MSRTTNFALIGTGGVGRALLEMIMSSRDHHASTYGLWLNACLVADSSGAIAAPSLADARLRDALKLKESGGKLKDMSGGDGVVARADGQTPSDFLSQLVDGLAPDTIVVDCTATDDTSSALESALAKGQRVVCANKKPFSGTQALYDALVGHPHRHIQRVRHESTVGAGLPVIAALQRLTAANDPVKRVAGTFSGTLGYVMTGLQEGRPFSAIVTEAKELGYTEPDPRDDLGGVDVARKALIIARGMGWRMEMKDVAVEPLYPADFASLSVDDFMKRLPELDAGFADKASAAKAQGQTLRYAASIEDGKLTVGPQTVALTSPLGSLSGTDNLVEFYTKWYPESPLVVRGAGAGAGTTAAGILADMVELAFSQSANTK